MFSKHVAIPLPPGAGGAAAGHAPCLAGLPGGRRCYRCAAGGYSDFEGTSWGARRQPQSAWPSREAIHTICLTTVRACPAAAGPSTAAPQTADAPPDLAAASEEQLRRFLQQAGWPLEAVLALPDQEALAAAARSARCVCCPCTFVACLPAHTPRRSPACAPTCLPSRPPACPPAYLPSRASGRPRSGSSR